MSLRDTLGRVVREAWVKWARTRPDPKPEWFLPWDEMPEPIREADRQIGEAVLYRVAMQTLRFLALEFKDLEREVETYRSDDTSLSCVCSAIMRLRTSERKARDEFKRIHEVFASWHLNRKADDPNFLDDIRLYSTLIHLDEKDPESTLYSDMTHAQLTAEVKQFRAANNLMANHQIPALKAEVERLKAEDGHYEGILAQIDAFAHEHFDAVGNPMPKGTNFGEAAICLKEELARLQAENERLHRELDHQRRVRP